MAKVVNVMVDKGTTERQRKWSQFVEMNKYFRVPVTRSQSAPCLHLVRKMRSAPACGTTKLSLSWQLACNPADSPQLQDDCVQRSHSKSDRHLSQSQSKDLKYQNSSGKRKPKMKPTSQRNRSNVMAKPKLAKLDLPKIMVVDATKKMSPLSEHYREEQAYREERQAHKDRVRRLHQELRKERKLDSQRVCKPDQPAAIRARKPRGEMPVKPKRTYGVPLCHRPTMLLGPRYYRDLQYYNQQQYYNQLQEQQRQQQLMQYRHYYKPMKHMAQPQQGYYDQGPRYAVPIESMYDNIRKGSRYCGNFYYK